MKLEVKDLIYKHQLNNNFCLGPLSLTGEGYLRVLGANGSGKTTLLKCLAGIYRASKGTAYLAGKELDHVIWVGAEAAIYWDSLTAKEYIMLQAKLYGVAKSDAEKKLVKFKLDYLNQNIFSLSTGQKKIISIISCVISACPLVIMDEPDSNLDEANREFLYDLILQESSLRKQFFLFSSHIPSNHFSEDNTKKLNAGHLMC